MTLREFVHRGGIGTRTEREAFESGLVLAHARAIERGCPPPGRWAIDENVNEELWALAFLFTRRVLRQLGQS